MSRAQVLNDELPSGFCPANYQDLLNNFSNKQYILLDDNVSQLIVSATKPDDETLAWLQLDQFGRPVRLYWFAQGAWLSMHPQPPGFVMPWFDAVPNFTTFDGGDAATPNATPISGPMWERITDANIQARFPLTTGTLPSTLVIAQGDTGGAEKHALLMAEMPAHDHAVNTGPTVGNDDKGPNVTSGSAPVEPPNPIIQLPEEIRGGDVNGITVAHNNMPPFIGMCWLRRTVKLYYVVP